MSKEIKLGFGHDPRSVQYVFVGGSAEEGQRPFLWYSLDEGTKVPIYDVSLTGYLVDIKCVKTVYKKDDAFKYDFHIRGDREYVIRSGVDTVFSRGAMLDLENISKETLESPISFIVQKGDDPKIVFSRLYFWANESSRDREWDSDKKLFPILNDLQELLGTEKQTSTSIQEDFEARAAKRNLRQNG